MTPRWEDVNARARGLGTHLLNRGDLDALARQPDLAALGEALGRAGIIPSGGPEEDGAEPIERAIRRWAAALLRTLARWVGARSAALPLVFELEDRRSLRALFRGAVAGVPAARRLASLVPTPALPERALAALASLSTVQEIAALLSVWRHPIAGPLSEVATAGPADLLAIERALGGAMLGAATRAARRSGSRGLRELVADEIDLENVAQALVLAGGGEAARSADWFLPGGARLTLDAFTRAIGCERAREAGRLLALALAGTPYAQAIADGSADPGRLESSLLRLRIALLTRRVRIEPLEPLTTLLLAFRLRGQVIDLQRIVWTVALGAPRTALMERWTSVAA